MLEYAGIVKQADKRIHHAHERQGIEEPVWDLQDRVKYVEFTDKSDGRGYTGQGKQENGHDHGKERGTLAEAGVSVDINYSQVITSLFLSVF